MSFGGDKKLRAARFVSRGEGRRVKSFLEFE
jgi:hypothetical protein